MSDENLLGHLRMEAKASRGDCLYFVKQFLHMDPQRGYDVAKDYCITLVMSSGLLLAGQKDLCCRQCLR